MSRGKVKYYLKTDRCGKQYISIPLPTTSIEDEVRKPILTEVAKVPNSDSVVNRYVHFVSPDVDLDKLLLQSEGVPTLHLSAGSYRLFNLGARSAVWILSEFSVLSTKFEPKIPVHVSVTGGTIVSSSDEVLFRLDTDSSTLLVNNTRIISENSAIVVTSEGNYKFIGCSVRSKGNNTCIRAFHPCELDLKILEAESVCLDARTKFQFKCDRLVSRGIGITNNVDNNFQVNQMNCITGVRNDSGNLRLTSSNILCDTLCNVASGKLHIKSELLEFKDVSGNGDLTLTTNELFCKGSISCNVNISSNITSVTTDKWITSRTSKLCIKDIKFEGDCIVDGEQSVINIDSLTSTRINTLFQAKHLSGEIKSINAVNSTLLSVDRLDIKLGSSNLYSLGSVNIECDLRFRKLISKLGINVSGVTRISGKSVISEQEFLRVLSGTVDCYVRNCVVSGISDPDPDKAQSIIRVLQNADTLRLSGYYQCTNTYAILLEVFGKSTARLELHNVILRSGKPSIRVIGGYNTIVTLDCMNSCSNFEPEIDSGNIIYPTSKLIIN